MKTLVLSIISVVLFTFCTISVSYAQQQGPEKGRDFPKGTKGLIQHRNEMVKKLKLTDQQKDKIADLRTAFQKSMVDLHADLKKNQIDLNSLRSKDNLNRDDVLAAVEKVNKSKNAISLTVANHLFDVYQVLTPEQQKTWKANAHDTHRWGGRGHGGFDGGGRDRDGFGEDKF